MEDKPLEFWRSRAAVAEALDVFNSPYMQDVWAKALSRLQGEPEAAVTSARTLLESVCKHILESAKVDYPEGMSLPRLYALTAKELDIAPSDQLAPVFNTMFTACAELIKGVGILRNELSDSHGRGQFGAMPHWRHAELAVNLSGAMATYLAALWKARQPTVSEVIGSWLANRPESNQSTRNSLQKIARGGIGGLIAAKLRTNDVVSYFAERTAAEQLKPLTIRKNLVLLRSALGGNSLTALAEAEEILKEKAILSNVWVPVKQRVSHQDEETLLTTLRQEAPKIREDHLNKGTAAAMAHIVEFALWSGRLPNEFLSLQWGDVDFKKHTCKLPKDKQSFPVLERAWEIIEERRSNTHKPDDRIFPFRAVAVSMRHKYTVNRLVLEGKLKFKIRFHDYRYEAVYRLLEKDHKPVEVARATGQHSVVIHKIMDDLHARETAAQ